MAKAKTAEAKKDADFAKLRDSLRTTVKSAWKEDKGGTFKAKLTELFGEKLVNEYMECALTEDFDECLRKAANDAGLGKEYAAAWVNAPAELRKKLANVSKKWGTAERSAIKAAMRKAEIPRLFKLCATGRIEEVAKELGIDKPKHYKDCVRAVAEAQKLGDTLRGLWPEEA